ncbi:unnamed protein product [Aphanomyces euteiches]|nr:hypothetical protein AeRB84_001570 [Aphanomyces euteiches]
MQATLGRNWSLHNLEPVGRCMGKKPAQLPTHFVVPQPKRYFGGKIKRDYATAVARVVACRALFRPIDPASDDIPLDECFDSMMQLDNSDHEDRWDDDGRPLSAASNRSFVDMLDDNDDPLSDDDELLDLQMK